MNKSNYIVEVYTQDKDLIEIHSAIDYEDAYRMKAAIKLTGNYIFQIYESGTCINTKELE